MKKLFSGILFAVFITAGLLLFSFLVTPKAYADCNTSHFPYGFFACAGPGFENEAEINIYDASGNNVSGGSAIMGTQLTVQTKYTPQGSPRKNGNQPGTPFVWTYIDGDNFTTPSGDPAFVTGISNGGGEGRCPGTSGNYPGVVFGYIDRNNADRRDSSPFAFNPSNNTGVFSCGDHGRAVYWNNAPGNTNLTFNVNTKPSRQGLVCFRTLISVRFDGDDPTNPFPPGHSGYEYSSSGTPVPTFASDNSGSQHFVASHIAYGSRQVCVNITNTPPQGSITLTQTCGTKKYEINGARDPDHNGSGVIYQIRGTNPGWPADPTTWVINFSPNGSGNESAAGTNSSGFAWGTANFQENRRYLLRVWDPDLNDYVTTGSDVMPPDSCPDDPPSYTVDVRCDGVVLRGVNDINIKGGAHGNGVFIFAKFYQRHSPTSYPPISSNLIDAEWDDIRGDFFIPWPWQYADGNNQGWSVHIGDVNVNRDGNDDRYTSGIFNGHLIRSWRNVATVEGGCYQASCSLDVNENVPGSPNGSNAVRVNENFNVTGTITNPVANANVSAHYNTNYRANPDAPYNPFLPANWILAGSAFTPNNALSDDLAGNQLALTNGGGDDYDTGVIDFFPAGGSIPRGGSATRTFTLQAPNRIGNTGVIVYPDYWGRMALGGVCGTPISAYRHYHLTPRASLENFNEEDPTTIQYRTWLTAEEDITNPPDPITGVPAQTQRRLYKQGAPTNIDGVHTDTRRFTARDYGSSSHANPYPIVAGERYCAELSMTHHDGWIGPGDSIYGNVPLTTTSCDTVVNKPFWKVYGTGVSAGGDFNSPYTGGGTIGGWHNSGATYPGFGASTELHALALKEIVGFGTSRNTFNDSDSISTLAFANKDLPANPFGTTPPTNNNYSPFTGGYFKDNNSGGARKLPNTQPKPGITKAPSRTIPGRTVAVGQNVEEFVSGDVHITNNITYNTAGWAQNPDGTTNIPSFKVVTDGNIYIAPNVTRLDGYYEAKGQIYTCANSTGNGPVSKNSTFTTCRNQLTVHGSFVAKKVNLMRTFGSLRNEKPVITASYDVTTTTGQSVNLYRFGCSPSGHYYSTSAGAAPGGCSLEGSLGGILPGQTNGSVPIYMWTDFSPSVFVGYGFAPGSQPPGTKPVYVVHNTDTNTYLYTNSQSAESYGYPTSLAFYVYNTAGMGGTTTTTTVPSSTNPPTLPLRCSNSQAESPSGGIRSSTRETCAAEVFDFSPEFYLSKNPNVQPPAGGLQYDAFTSLPPVL